jgi:hypothetical protein
VYEGICGEMRSEILARKDGAKRSNRVQRDPDFRKV